LALLYLINGWLRTPHSWLSTPFLYIPRRGREASRVGGRGEGTAECRRAIQGRAGKGGVAVEDITILL